MTMKTTRTPFGELPIGERTVVPFRWFEAAVERIKRLYPDEAEQKTCMVDVTIHGCTIEHTLTAAEQVVELRAQLEAAQARILELEMERAGERDLGLTVPAGGGGPPPVK